MSQPSPKPVWSVWPPPHRLYAIAITAVWLFFACMLVAAYVALRWQVSTPMPSARFAGALFADLVLAALLALWLHRHARRWARACWSPRRVLSRLIVMSLLFFAVALIATIALAWLRGAEIDALIDRGLLSRLPAAAVDYSFFWAVALSVTPLPFLRMMDRIRRQPVAIARPPAGARKLTVRTTGALQYIAYRDVLGLTAAENYVELHLADRDLLHRATLAQMQEAFAEEGFLKIHRSAMVRLSAVAACERDSGDRLWLRLHSGRRMPVSRSHRAAVLAALSPSASVDEVG
ncbi:MAG: LytTR family transcriptional regulator [Lysobacteraceae bacterium]|nr:MAG: LytTR family transcriptional regulator [Xanthomonadaceae bacterium]